MKEANPRRPARGDAVALCVLLAATAAFCLPLLARPLGVVRETDWLQKASYLAVGRRALAEHGQFPLWSPYFGGGYPLMGHPENMLYNPAILALALAGNEWLALKMIAVCAYLCGAAGMYLFARRVLGHTVPGGLFSAFLFAFNGYLPFHTHTGNFMEATYYYLPLLMLFLFFARTNARWAVAAGLLLAWNILGDGGLQVPNILLFLAVLYLSGAAVSRRGRRNLVARFGVLLLSFSLAALFASIKLLPMAEVLRQNPRRLESYEKAAVGSAGPGTIADSLLLPGPFTGADRPAFPDGSPADSTIYMGVIPLLFAGAAFIFRWRKTRALLIPLILFTLLAMGDRSPVDLFRLLWHLPLYGSLRTPNKYFSFFIAFIIAAAAGAVLPGSFRKKRVNLLIAALAIIAAARLFLATLPYHLSLAGSPPPRWPRQSFYQVMSRRDDGLRHRYERDQYFLVLQGIGKINWYGNIYLAENAVPRYFYVYPHGSDEGWANPAYRGETFFLRGLNGARIAKWSPAELEIEVTVREEDTLIINQNYDRNWKTDTGRLLGVEGLLAVEGIPPGEHTVKLSYEPVAFRLGGAITCLSLLAALAWLFMPRRHKDTKIRTI